MKTTLLIASTVALFACVATAPAAPAHNKDKTARIHEIHCVQDAPCAKPSAPVSSDASLFRSHAELETVNPG